MNRVQTRAGPVAYVEYDGAGSGPPVVLLHAVGHDHRDFDAIAPALAAHHRTIAIDWPGFGASPPPEPATSATTATMCDVLEDVVDGLRLPPAIFVGNSVGGTASVRLAARRPDRVRALVLVDTGGFTPMHALARAFCRVQGSEWIRRVTGPAFARFYTKRRNAHVDAMLARVDAGARNPASVAVHAAMWRSFADASSDMRAEAAAIACPTLVVWGRRDPVLRAALDGRAVRACMPAAAWAELDTGHVPFVEDPEAFLAGALPFLRSLVDGERVAAT
jgi:pimeloyl-ACP methyl ester carboxylesterase